MQLSKKLRDEYEWMWQNQIIMSLKGDIDFATRFIASHSDDNSVYKEVSMATRVPVEVIGVTHMRESSFNFTRHLHNGDPLTGRTIQVPAGRPIDPPAVGASSYSWKESAIDAIFFHADSWGFDLAHATWDPAFALLWCETYCGFGYRNNGLVSPYVWSGTQFYSRGKYGSDGHYDPLLVDQEAGCAPVLKALAFK